MISIDPAYKSRQLGYGCSMLMSQLDWRHSLRLLECAFDSGITYFDTARRYGYGEAESVLGSLLTGKRDKIIVATKAGILPPPPSGLMSVVKKAVRAIVTVSPQLKAYFRRKAESMLQPGRFDVATITSSLETSLRELRTDYIDLFLLHECQLQHLDDPALLEFLVRTQKQGKIRRFGVATTFAETEKIIDLHPEYAPVLQFASDVWNRNINRIEQKKEQPIVIHSILGKKFMSFYSQLQNNSEQLSLWNRYLDIDCRDITNLGSIFLGHALNSNPNGVTLFSSVSEAKIRKNAETACQMERVADRTAALLKLIETLPPLEEPK